MAATGGRRRGGLAACALLLGLASGCATDRLWTPGRGEILQRILPSSVQVVLEQDGRRFRTGSGVVIAASPTAHGTECFVITSGHTLARLSGQETVYVLFGRQRGAGTKAVATVLAQRDTEDLDLALLRARSDTCVPARLGAPPALGDEIWVVAFPWGRNMTLAGGIVSQLNDAEATDRESASRLMVDASVSYGASGGGVYEARHGSLIGLVEGYRTARVSFKGDATSRYIDVPVPGETYVIPLADIWRFLALADQTRLVAGRPALAPPKR
jgi:S1-C subfamily serine protease